MVVKTIYFDEFVPFTHSHSGHYHQIFYEMGQGKVNRAVIAHPNFIGIVFEFDGSRPTEAAFKLEFPEARHVSNIAN